MPTEQWLAEVLARPGYRVLGVQPPTSAVEPPWKPAVSAVILAPDRPPTAIVEPQGARFRSKTEARYADQLAWRVAAGEVKRWIYEPFSLRLGMACHYRPDFLLEYVEPMPLQLVEVKGAFIRSRAMEKPRAAATRFPFFTFVLAQWAKQRWTHTRIAAHG